MTTNGWWYPSALQPIYAYQKAWIFAGGGGAGGGVVLFCFVFFFFWIDEELVLYVN